MFRLQLRTEIFQDCAHSAGVLNKVVFFVDLNGGQGGSTSHWMRIVSQTTIKDLVLKVLSDVMSHANCAQGQITRSKSLCHRDQVRHNMPVIDGKPFAGAAETGH